MGMGRRERNQSAGFSCMLGESALSRHAVSTGSPCNTIGTGNQNAVWRPRLWAELDQHNSCAAAFGLQHEHGLVREAA